MLVGRSGYSNFDFPRTFRNFKYVFAKMHHHGCEIRSINAQFALQCATRSRVEGVSESKVDWRRVCTKSTQVDGRRLAAAIWTGYNFRWKQEPGKDRRLSNAWNVKTDLETLAQVFPNVDEWTSVLRGNFLLGPNIRNQCNTYG